MAKEYRFACTHVYRSFWEKKKKKLFKPKTILSDGPNIILLISNDNDCRETAASSSKNGYHAADLVSARCGSRSVAVKVSVLKSVITVF